MPGGQNDITRGAALEEGGPAAPNARPPVWADFANKPWRYDFWRALALARRLNQGPPRLKSSPRLHFAPGPVAGQEDEGRNLYLNLDGLAGPGGPLPLWLAELAHNRARHGQGALSEFWDIFNSRYWDLYQDVLGRLRPEAGPDEGRGFAKILWAAAGVLGEGLRGRPLSTVYDGPQPPSENAVPQKTFLAAAQVWGLFPRSAAGLELLVRLAFGVKARVKPLTGAWLKLPVGQRTILGGPNNRLGQNALCGGEIFDPAAGFTLTLGPLDDQQYRAFLPPPAGDKRGELMALVRWYAGDAVECVVQIDIN